MNEKIFFEQFGHLAESEGGIQKLRNLILQLAVQGKLVEQDPNDEPASELLRRIEEFNKGLQLEKKIRKQQIFPNIQKSNYPYQIPKTWLFVYAGRLGDWGSGSTPNRKEPSYYSGSVMWFKSGELNGTIIKESEEKITEKALKECSLRINQVGDVAIAMYGATIGKTAIVGVKSTTNQAVCVCTPFSGVYNEYLHLSLKGFKNFFIGQGAGGAQPNISREKIINTPIPLPPLAEQYRIVEKVDALMALCDRLEEEQKKQREKTNQSIVSTLHYLSEAETPKAFTTSFNILNKNFQNWFTTPESIKKLRATILQLAVQGKLVEQDPNDEPASELLKKIEAEKEKLKLKTGDNRIKKAISPLPNSYPYELPFQWSIESFENLFLFIDYRGKTPPKTSFGVPLITAKNIRMGKLNKFPEEFIDIDTYSLWMTRGIPRLGDIFFTTEAPLGNVCINDLKGKFALAQRIICLQPYGFICSRYIMYSLMSQTMQQIILNNSSGTTARGIKSSKLKPLPIPLPPLAEQYRIVEKVDALMALCDRLEEELIQSSKVCSYLTDSLISHLSEVAL